VLVATAHPAKFPEVVEPLVGMPIEPPPALVRLLGRALAHEEVGADFEGFRERLLAA
jgi:threonine synthase